MSKIDEYRRFHQGKNTRYVLTCNFYLAIKDNQLNVLIYGKNLYVFSLFSYSLYIYIGIKWRANEINDENRVQFTDRSKNMNHSREVRKTSSPIAADRGNFNIGRMGSVIVG